MKSSRAILHIPEKTTDMIPLGTPAPPFSLLDQHARLQTLDSYKGKWVILYFYPKDDTPGCTLEACEFRDQWEMIEKKNAVILGISKDSVHSHQKFAKKFHLPFTLLSDPTTQTAQAYEVWGKKKFMGREYMGMLRTTFLITPQGIINHVYENVTPLGHVEQILADLSASSS